MPRSTLYAAAAVAVLLLGGCGGDDPPEAVATTPGPSETRSWPSARPSATAPQEPTVADLPAGAYDVVTRVRHLRGDDLLTGVAAVGEDGTLLLTRSRQSIEGPLDEIGPSWLVLREPDGRTTTIRPPERKKNEQIAGAEFDDRHVVWMGDAAVELGVAPWVLYAYDRSTGGVRELARAPELDGRVPPALPGYTEPQIHEGYVFWAQAGGTVGKETVDVMGCRISACVPEVYVENAAFPDVAGDALYAIRTRRFAGAGRSPSMQVVRHDLPTGDVRVVRTMKLREAAPSGLSASKRGVAWTLDGSQGTSIVVRDQASGQETVFRGAPHERFGYPAMTERLVAWAEGSGNSSDELGGYLYDRRTGERWAIGNASGLYGIEGAGSVVQWQEARPERDGGERIVNVVARLR
ncbi:hypothetical protein [Mumia sp. DW29H23]|uniref:hypothetical protein n=1 Tax=Mumia sp. DW29H23 TaxID=3421241 RepID=UPI003D68F85C